METYKYNDKVTLYLPPGFTHVENSNCIQANPPEPNNSLSHGSLIMLDVQNSDARYANSNEPVRFAPGEILDFLLKVSDCSRHVKTPGPPYAMFISAVSRTGWDLLDHFGPSFALVLYIDIGESEVFAASTFGSCAEDPEDKTKYKDMMKIAKAVRVYEQPLSLEGIDENVLKDNLGFQTLTRRELSMILARLHYGHDENGKGDSSERTTFVSGRY